MSILGLNDPDDNGMDSYVNYYFWLQMAATLFVSMYTLAYYAESRSHFKYEDRAARIIAGLVSIMMRVFHSDLKIHDLTKTALVIEPSHDNNQITTSSIYPSEFDTTKLKLSNTEGKLIAIGPHRTGWEGTLVAAALNTLSSDRDLTPVRFIASDTYTKKPYVGPLVAKFYDMFKAILVKENAQKSTTSSSANSSVIDDAVAIINQLGCVCVFPQGNFSRIGQEPHRIYEGIAKMAVRSNTPVQVLRLDGFWCMQNFFIPVSWRNNQYYRAFFSALHPNNVQTNLCTVIDCHLKTENADLNEEKKIRLICAELYAYYRHTQDLTPKQISIIKSEIKDQLHLTIWDNKVKRDDLTKQIKKLDDEIAPQKEATQAAMNSALIR